MSVTRYSPAVSDFAPCAFMDKDSDGQWVSFEEYAALQSELQTGRDLVEVLLSQRKSLEKERDELRSKLDEAKNESCELRDMLSNSGIKV